MPEVPEDFGWLCLVRKGPFMPQTRASPFGSDYILQQKLVGSLIAHESVAYCMWGVGAGNVFAVFGCCCYCSADGFRVCLSQNQIRRCLGCYLSSKDEDIQARKRGKHPT